MNNYKKYTLCNNQKCWKWVLMKHRNIPLFFPNRLYATALTYKCLGTEKGCHPASCVPGQRSLHTLTAYIFILLATHWFPVHTPRGVNED